MSMIVKLPRREDPEITRQRNRLLEQWSDWFEAWHRFEASMAQVAAWPDLFTLKEKAATEWFRSSRLNENDRRKPTRIRDAELVILCLEEIAESRGEILYTLDDTLQMLLRGKKALEDGSELLEGLEAAKKEFRDISDDIEKIRENLKKAKRLSIKIINISKPEQPSQGDGIVTITGKDLERARHGETVVKKVPMENIWHPTWQGPYPGKDPDPMNLFWAQMKGIYDLNKGQVIYDTAAKLAVTQLKGLIPDDFKIPPKPNWWTYPW